MRGRIIYTKLQDGRIEAEVRVTFSGDFPTEYVFDSTDEVNLVHGTRNVAVFFDDDEGHARYKAIECIKELRKKLDDWRKIYVPPDEEFEI